MKFYQQLQLELITNIRELEGTLNKLIATASLTHSPITLEMAAKSDK